MWAPKPYRDAVALQKVVFKRITEDGVDDKFLGNVVRAWIDLERLKRDMTGKPNPKPIDVTKLLNKRQQGLIELNPT